MPSPIDRVFGAIVPKAVDAIDPDDLVQRIDLDHLIDRLDVAAVIDRVDVGAVIDRVDVDGLIQRVDVDGLIQRVDVDGLIQRVDVDGLIQRVDVDGLVGRIDLDALVGRLDLDALVGRLDVDALMSRVDVDALMQRVDLDALLSRVDLNAVLTDVDVRALAARAGIDQIVAEATTGLAARVLNTARRQVLAIDTVLCRIIDRVLRRAETSAPAGEGLRPAGPLGRLLAFLADSAVVSVLFSLGVTLATFLVQLFTGRDFDPARNGGFGWALAYGGWWLLYLWLSIGVSGRTVGKGLVGLRVVATDGSAVGARRAALRTLAFPFSFILGLGFIPMVVGPRRRAAHDHVAGTLEVVEWEGGPGVAATAVVVDPVPAPVA